MENRNVPYIVYEGTVARFERTVRRLIIALIVAFLLLFCTNAMWLMTYEKHECTSITVDTSQGSHTNFIGSNGVIENNEERP